MFYQPDLSNINLGWMWDMFKKKRRKRIRFELYGCFKQSTCEVQRGAGYVIASGTSRIWITHNQIGRQIITINSWLQSILEARKFRTSNIRKPNGNWAARPIIVLPGWGQHPATEESGLWVCLACCNYSRIDFNDPRGCRQRRVESIRIYVIAPP